MRLIDKKKLMFEVADGVEISQVDTKAFQKIVHIIDMQPEVDPVKHGHWKTVNDRYFHCSLCDAKDESRRNYCHGCGAKMDLEK